jgi:uncharacterized repeat protein (TIGR03803 family)
MVLMPTIVATRPAQAPDRGPTYSVLYSFTGETDGANPWGGVVEDAAGNLYGTTVSGGMFGCFGSLCGVVFKVDSSGKETVLHNFTGGSDGGYPYAGLLRDAAGNLYGTTATGGSGSCFERNGCRVVFKLDTTGMETVLHTFREGCDGAEPFAGLIRDSIGNLYGTTWNGGNCGRSNLGVVFKVDTTGKETVLHSFGVAAGTQASALLRDAAGNLYGTTAEGGSGCGLCGVVFKLNTAGKLKVLHSFRGSPGPAQPYSWLVRDTAGNLYGTTFSGGAFGDGVVFQLDTSGKLTLLHNFTGGADGANPYAGLLRGASGKLYGTTSSGGSRSCGPSAAGCGVVFKIDTTGKETVLHSFDGTDGSYPSGGLWRDAAGNLYGTTQVGGTSDSGVVFKLTP